jgi:hypothetical protein
MDLDIVFFSNILRPKSLLGLIGCPILHRNRVIELIGIQRNLHNLVEALTTPLFSNFDFYELPASERNRLIGKNLIDWGIGNPSESLAADAEGCS